MTILEKLETEIKNAMKARDEERLNTVRLIKSAVKNKEIELLHPLSEDEFLGVCSSIAKKHRESIDAFKKGNRNDLVEKEEKQLAITESFLPKPLSDSEVDALIAQAVQSTAAAGPKDMGLVMKALKEKTTGRTDGKTLSDKVRQKLSGL